MQKSFVGTIRKIPFFLKGLLGKLASPFLYFLGPIFFDLYCFLKLTGGAVRFAPGVKVKGLSRLKIQKDAVIGEDSEIMIDSGASVFLANGVRIGNRCSVIGHAGNAITIHNNSTFHGDVRLIGNIEIGAGCLFARNIFLSSYGHRFKDSPELPIRKQDQEFKSKNLPAPKITIGDDCWLGWGVVVSSGVTIGKGSIIGANSVVTKDVPPYSVIGGIPGKVISNRLAFNPSLELSSQDPKHFPYFYSGFLLEKDRILPYRKQVQIAMPVSTQTVSLTLRASNPGQLVIREKDQIVFEGPIQKEGHIEFKCPTASANELRLLSLEFSTAQFEIAKALFA